MRRTWLWTLMLRSLRPSARQRALHQQRVVPAAELEADVGQAARLDEAEGAVDLDGRWIVGHGDARDDLAHTGALALGQQLFEQRLAHAAAARLGRDVDRVLDGEAVGAAVAV